MGLGLGLGLVLGSVLVVVHDAWVWCGCFEGECNGNKAIHGARRLGGLGKGGGHATCPSRPHGTAVPVTGSRKIRRCLSLTCLGLGLELG